MQQVLEISTNLSPLRFFYKGETFPISKIKNDDIITRYKVYLVNGSIDRIIINAKHPNAHPGTGEFCLDKQIKNQIFDNRMKKFIEMVMCNFYLDDCYFKPWLDFDWEE